MLGFQVFVERVVSDSESIQLAWWQCRSLTLLDNLVELGRAELVEDRGGYPDRYRVVAREILHLFEPAVRDELPDVLHLSSGIGSPWALKIDDSACAACPADAVLTVTAWDQS